MNAIPPPPPIGGTGKGPTYPWPDLDAVQRGIILKSVAAFMPPDSDSDDIIGLCEDLHRWVLHGEGAQ